MLEVDLPPSLDRQCVALALLPTPSHCITYDLLSQVDQQAPGELCETSVVVRLLCLLFASCDPHIFQKSF